MQPRRISSGSKFERLYGHSRAVALDNVVFVAGTVGFDYANDTIVDDAAEQTRQTFRNIETALQQAGASLSDLITMLLKGSKHQEIRRRGKLLESQSRGGVAMEIESRLIG